MSIIITLLVLNMLIFTHEFGHYITARAAGVHVKEFAIGFGKKIVSFTKDDTTYSLRLIPLGGFCSLQGMIESDRGKEGSNFIEKSIPWRILIIAAGAIMNLLLATILLFIMNLIMFNPPIHLALLGSVKTVGFTIQTIFSALQGIASGGAQDVAGPIGMVSMIGEAIKSGEILLFYMAVISINLGIMNLLPIPGLDGSRIVFLIIEAIKKKPISSKKEALIHGIGLVFLLVLMILVTYQDVVKLL